MHLGPNHYFLSLIITFMMHTHVLLGFFRLLYFVLLFVFSRDMKYRLRFKTSCYLELCCGVQQKIVTVFNIFNP